MNTRRCWRGWCYHRDPAKDGITVLFGNQGEETRTDKLLIGFSERTAICLVHEGTCTVRLPSHDHFCLIHDNSPEEIFRVSQSLFRTFALANVDDASTNECSRR